MRQILGVVVVALTATLSTSALAAQVHHVAELDSEQIRALDRERTVVLLPGGILEQHGPYLPSYSDGFMNERLTRELADAIVASGRQALVFPVIPLGAHGAEIIGRQYDYPGSHTLRASTLRDLFMDLGDTLGEQGFRRIFVVHLHGAPEHNRALDQAGDYFRDTHGGTMVHLAGLMPVFGALGGTLTPEQQAEEGFSVHAGVEETSINLFLRPDLVRPGLDEARSIHSADAGELVDHARLETWPGYFGAPRLATAEQGARIWAQYSEAALETALDILDGLDPAQLPRYADLISQDPHIAEVNRDALAHDADREARQAEWLRARGIDVGGS